MCVPVCIHDILCLPLLLYINTTPVLLVITIIHVSPKHANTQQPKYHTVQEEDIHVLLSLPWDCIKGTKAPKNQLYIYHVQRSLCFTESAPPAFGVRRLEFGVRRLAFCSCPEEGKGGSSRGNRTGLH